MKLASLGNRLAGIAKGIATAARGSNPLLVLSYLRGKIAVTNSFTGGKPSGIDLYNYFSFKYWWRSPPWLRSHRFYFSRHFRGFGEDPFHAAWLEIFLHFKPVEVLEIGVYRGQTISLWQLIAQKHSMEISVYGISPMTEEGDSVSKYVSIDYKSDINLHFKKFGLKSPTLVQGLSTDFNAIEFVRSKEWDLIYIDGSHEFEVVLSDYKNSVRSLKHGGVICLDDSSLYLNVDIDGLFKGHPGPSKVVSEYAFKELRHLMTVGHNNFFVKD